jgi:uncharacterized membrane protein (UPF0127 family)
VRKVLLVLLLALCACARSHATEVKIGHSVFHVQVAATEALREHGLMGVRALASDRGMLFLWDDVAARQFYMKDTLIPLDLISIRARQVVGVARMVPCLKDPCPITTTPPADAALEVPAGTAKRAGITAGAPVEISSLLSAGLLEMVA